MVSVGTGTFNMFFTHVSEAGMVETTIVGPDFFSLSLPFPVSPFLPPCFYKLANLGFLTENDFKIFGILILFPTSKREEVEAEDLSKTGSELAHCHFYCILLVKASHKVNPDLRTGKIDSTSGHVKQNAHHGAEELRAAILGMLSPLCLYQDSPSPANLFK